MLEDFSAGFSVAQQSPTSRTATKCPPAYFAAEMRTSTFILITRMWEFLAGFLVIHKPVTSRAAANSLVAYFSAELGAATIFDITWMCLGWTFTLTFDSQDNIFPLCLTLGSFKNTLICIGPAI